MVISAAAEPVRALRELLCREAILGVLTILSQKFADYRWRDRHSAISKNRIFNARVRRSNVWAIRHIACRPVPIDVLAPPRAKSFL